MIMKSIKFKQTTKEELWRRLIFIGLLFLLIIIFSQKIRFTTIDLGRHLENGKIVWQNAQVLFTNFYSYTETNFPFINHHWFAGVIYYAVYSTGGFKLLSLFNILLILSAFSLAFSLSKKRLGFYLTALLSLPVIFLLSERVEIRPEMFSYLFFFITWFIIEKVEEKKHYHLLWWLLPLFFLWVNVHIYFFLGLALIAFKAMAEFWPSFIKQSGRFKIRIIRAWRQSKVWWLNLLYITIICLFNPNTIKGLLYPFSILKNYGYEIAENKSIFYLSHLMLNYNFFLFKLLFLLLILSWLSYFFFSQKMRWFELAVSILFSVMALLFSRNLAIFALVAWVVISINLRPVYQYAKKIVYSLRIKKINCQSDLVAGALLFLFILASAVFLSTGAYKAGNFSHGSLGWGLDQGATDSIKFFKANKLSGPIFNNYDIGSALIFWLYPQEKVFVDNRPEAYGKEFFNTIYRPLQNDNSVWLKRSKKYNINLIYFSYTDSTPWARKFLYQRLNDPNWSLIYFDRYAVIMLRNREENKKLIARLALNPNQFRTRLRKLVSNSTLNNRFNLAGLASLAGQEDLSKEIYQKILFDQPDQNQALFALGSLYANSSDRNSLDEALKYIQESIKQGYLLPAAYNQKGLVYWRLKDYRKAETSWRQSLKLDKSNASALAYLKQVKQFKLRGVISK